MSILQKLLFGFILLAYLAAGGLYAGLTPRWQAPDEPAHYNYIRHLALKATFPELLPGCYDQNYLAELKSRHFPPELSIQPVCYEFHQPPLYYLLLTPIFVFSNGTLGVLRLLSVALGAGVISLAFLIAKTIFPNRLVIAYGTMIFVAFVPMHVAILSSINNDALAELILATVLYLLIRRLMLTPDPQLKQDLLLGFCLGLGLISKAVVYIAILLIAATLLLNAKTAYEKEKKVAWSRLFNHAVVIYGLAFVIAAPWYFRNIIIYGQADILGLKRHDDIVVGQLRTADLLADVGGLSYTTSFISTTYRSFWGQFGWMAVPMDGRTYFLLTLLCLIATAGLFIFLIKPSSSPLLLKQSQALKIMALTILLIVLGYSWYNITFVQFQGRYLFSGLIPLGIFFALGLDEALQRRWIWGLLGSLIIALLWLVIGSTLNGGLDKWGILIIGLVLALVSSRFVIDRYWPHATLWLQIGCYVALILLTLAGPFWFIIPYL